MIILTPGAAGKRLPYNRLGYALEAEFDEGWPKDTSTARFLPSPNEARTQRTPNLMNIGMMTSMSNAGFGRGAQIRGISWPNLDAPLSG